MKKYREVIKRPIVTEKTLRLAKDKNQYTFEVAPKASKGCVQETLEELYGVVVISVRTLPIPSKRRRVWRANRFTKTNSGKKAIVELKKGDKIEGFGMG